MMKHTPGPWECSRVFGDGVFDKSVEIYPPSAKPGEHQFSGPIAVVHVNDEVGDADVRLIAAAPDHAILLRAFLSGILRWERWDDKRGELCIGGLRHATTVDEFGCPVITQNVREAISKAEGKP